MYFGFRSLYLVALACYVIALVSEVASSRMRNIAPGGLKLPCVV